MATNPNYIIGNGTLKRIQQERFQKPRNILFNESISVDDPIWSSIRFMNIDKNDRLHPVKTRDVVTSLFD
jgi:hypothetical protein